MSKTTKKHYRLSYSVSHWGWIQTEAHSYKEACEEAWDKLYGSSSWKIQQETEGMRLKSSEYHIDDEDTHPEDWENPLATCAEEINEVPSSSEEDEEDEDKASHLVITVSNRELEVEE